MSVQQYMERVQGILERIATEERENLERAAAQGAESVAAGGWIYVFGSGHSVIPVLDAFPRYGGFVGFYPLMDPRLMWFNVTAPGGAPELIWLERQEGYIRNVLENYPFSKRDSLVVFSHGGLNAAPVEAALYGREQGMFTVGVTSGENQRTRQATHSSGKKLSDVVDVTIDNGCPPEDAVVQVEGQPFPMGASSTVAFTAIVNILVAEVGRCLGEKGIQPPTFVSPNVANVGPEHNKTVFEAFRRRVKEG